VQPATSHSRPGAKAELRREHGSDERTGAGDRGKVVAEEHPAAHRMEIRPVVLGVRRCDTRVIERHHLRGDEGAVIPVGNREDAHDRDDDVKGLHGRRLYSAG